MKKADSPLIKRLKHSIAQQEAVREADPRQRTPEKKVIKLRSDRMKEERAEKLVKEEEEKGSTICVVS